MFSVYALSDSGGSVIERYRFDAYGAATVLDADGSVDADGLSDVKNPYAFTGRRLAPESGRCGENVARDPSDGRQAWNGRPERWDRSESKVPLR